MSAAVGSKHTELLEGKACLVVPLLVLTSVLIETPDAQPTRRAVLRSCEAISRQQDITSLAASIAGSYVSCARSDAVGPDMGKLSTACQSTVPLCICC